MLTLPPVISGFARFITTVLLRLQKLCHYGTHVCFLLACLSAHVVYDPVLEGFIDSQSLHLLRHNSLSRHQSLIVDLHSEDFLPDLYIDGRLYRSGSVRLVNECSRVMLS
jgi:hypothetical protein